MTVQKFYVVRKWWQYNRDQGSCILGDGGYIRREDAIAAMKKDFMATVEDWSEWGDGKREYHTMTMFVDKRCVWENSRRHDHCDWSVDEITVNE